MNRSSGRNRTGSRRFVQPRVSAVGPFAWSFGVALVSSVARGRAMTKHAGRARHVADADVAILRGDGLPSTWKARGTSPSDAFRAGHRRPGMGHPPGPESAKGLPGARASISRPRGRPRSARPGQSCSTTLRSELLIVRPRSPLMKPSFLNLFMKKFTRDRVVPTISASVSCEIFGMTRCGLSSSP